MGFSVNCGNDVLKRRPWIWTIGHSRHKWEFFRDLLLAHRIKMVVDVRSHPYSRWAPWAKGVELRMLLEGIGVMYDYRGGALGGRPKDRALLDSDGKPDYSKMALHPAFLKDVDHVFDLASSMSDDDGEHEGLVIALLCSEENPDACHRKLLVGKALKEKGCGLFHIRARIPAQVDD